MKRHCWTRYLVLLFVLLWIASPVPSQELPLAVAEEVGLSSERLQRVDAVLQKAIDQKEIAGGVALIARKGKIAYLKAFGMMDMEAKKPMRTDTVFRIASMTKAITSVAAMMLYEEGYFMLTDPISKYIPEFEKPQVMVRDSSGSTVPARSEIKVWHLLAHTSGLSYQWNKHVGKAYHEAGITHGLLQDESTLAEKMKKLAKIPLLNHPGEVWHYGLSVDVLGYFVEVVSGMPLDEFFQTRIFDPLKMKDTHFFLPKNKVKRLAAVYRPAKDGGIERVPEGPISSGMGSFVYSVDYPYQGPRSYFSGGGGLCSTILDYARFCQMLLNGGELNGIRLLSRKTVELMTIDHVKALRKNDGFGLGFLVVRDLAKFRNIGSAGAYGWGGFFYTQFRIDPEEDMITLFMSQKYPRGGTQIADKFRISAYQAIVD